MLTAPVISGAVSYQKTA